MAPSLIQKENQELNKKIDNFLSTVPSKSKDIDFELEGVKRIFIEMENQTTEELILYTKKYTSLVNHISSILEEELEGLTGKKRERAVVKKVWKVVVENLKIKSWDNPFISLFESLNNYKFDCDTSAFLFYDIGKKLNINTRLVTTSEHALVATDNFFLETTKGKYRKIKYLKNYYKRYYILNNDQNQSITYDQLAMKEVKSFNYKKAKEFFDKAIALNNNDFDGYFNRGSINSILGNYKEAIEDFSKVISENPGDTLSHQKRSICYKKLGEIKKAEKDLKIVERLE